MNIRFLLLLTLSMILCGEVSKNELKDNILEKMESITSFQAEFSQEQEWELAGESTVSVGKIFMSGKDVYRIENGENYIIFNKKTVYRYNDETKQLLIEVVEDDQSGSMIPIKLIFDFPDFFNITDFIESETGYKLFLEPKNINESFILSLNVEIDKQFLVKSMEIVDIDDNTSKYKLNNIVLNEHIETSLFQQPKGSNIEIMDLR